MTVFLQVMCWGEAIFTSSRTLRDVRGHASLRSCERVVEGGDRLDSSLSQPSRTKA